MSRRIINIKGKRTDRALFEQALRQVFGITEAQVEELENQSNEKYDSSEQYNGADMDGEHDLWAERQ